MSFPPEKIRNVALVGHGGSGKTTLAEALLHVGRRHEAAGSRRGRHNRLRPRSRGAARGFSLSLAVAPFEWKGHKVNLIDTPGLRRLRRATRTPRCGSPTSRCSWCPRSKACRCRPRCSGEPAADLGLPRMVFVNKLDRERANFERVLDELRDRFGAGIAPLELPIGAEAEFRGVADLLTDTAWLYDGGKASHGEIPDDMEALEHQVHENLVEGIVVGDDDLMERYLDGDMPSVEQLEATLAVGVDEASVFPVVCGSATAEIGIDRLADFLCEIGPSPLDRPPVEVAAGDGTAPGRTRPGGPAAGVRVQDDRRPVRRPRDPVQGAVRHDPHRRPPRQHPVRDRGAAARASSRCVVGPGAGQPRWWPATSLRCRSCRPRQPATRWRPKGTPVTVPPIEFPEPLLGVAITARTQTDDDKLANALPRLLDEDPALDVRRDDETHQTILRGIGETHLAVAFDRLQRKFGVAVDTEDVLIAYRETITGTADAEGRHKKQSGGHGQFGVCSIRVAPRAAR